jgi:hypothetical protein
MSDAQAADALVESWKPHFVAAYERDDCNKSKQTLDEYWRWVRNLLLEGGSGFKGWMAQVDDLAAGVADAEAQARVRQMLYRVGRLIAAEWSKDSAYRKIFSTPWQGRPNLLELGRRFRRALARDAGDGAAIELAAAEIEAELLALLSG